MLNENEWLCGMLTIGLESGLYKRGDWGRPGNYALCAAKLFGSHAFGNLIQEVTA